MPEITVADYNIDKRMMAGNRTEYLTYMAMHEPHSWVVGLECNGQIAVLRQKSYVPPWRVVEVEGIDAGVHIVRLCALSEDDKVVAMKMNRMIVFGQGSIWESKILSGQDEVDKTLSVILWDDCVEWIESGVVKIQNCRI